MTYTPNLMRSSVVRQTIASETAQKTNWKNQSVSTVIEPSWRLISGKSALTSGPARKKPDVPMIWLPSPNANAKPTAQKQSAAIEKLTRIFAITVPAFLPREKPISRKAKPACMNITRMPAMSTQTELMPTSSGSLPAFARSSESPLASAAAGTANVASNPAPTPVAQRVLRISPPLSGDVARGPNLRGRRAKPNFCAESRGGPPQDHCPRVEDSPGPVLPAVEGCTT